MLRDPIELMHSLHNQRLSNRAETVEDFGAALDSDLQADHGGPGRSAMIERLGTYRDRARFGEQLRRWLDVFERHQIHVILFEDFRADTPTEFRKVLEFLDVDPDYRPETFGIHNPRGRRRSGIAGAVLRNPISRWLTNTLLPRLVGKQRASRLNRVVRQSSINRAPVERKPIDPLLRTKLEVELAVDVAEASALVGRDLGATWFSQGVETTRPATAGER